jgi:hypothetical protein
LRSKGRLTEQGVLSKRACISFLSGLCYTQTMKALNTIFSELLPLCRELKLILPSESIEDFSNKHEILRALKNHKIKK